MPFLDLLSTSYVCFGTLVWLRLKKWLKNAYFKPRYILYV